MNFAILLAAGIGSRFGKAVLKQRARLAGRAVYEHTLERLQSFDSISGILLIFNEDMLAERDQIKRRYPKVLEVIKGGNSRLESSYIGLRYLAPIAEAGSKVIIHDAVRPFVDEAMVGRILAALDEHDAVDPVIDSTDTIIVARDGFIESIPDRRNIKRGQTPQGFNFTAILTAFERALASGQELNFSDDCGLFLKYAEGCDPRVRLARERGQHQGDAADRPRDRRGNRAPDADRRFPAPSIASRADGIAYRRPRRTGRRH